MPFQSGKRRGARTPKRAWTDVELEAYAVRYMARFDCTEQRLRTVLQRKLVTVSDGLTPQPESASSTSIDRLIDRFKELGYLNDARFAARLVESLRLRGASSRKIRERLRTRGVGAELAGELLAANKTTSEDDLAAAITWVKRRRLGAHRPVEQRKDRYQRDLAALARAGFSFDVARRALALPLEDVD